MPIKLKTSLDNCNIIFYHHQFNNELHFPKCHRISSLLVLFCRIQYTFVYSMLQRLITYNTLLFTCGNHVLFLRNVRHLTNSLASCSSGPSKVSFVDRVQCPLLLHCEHQHILKGQQTARCRCTPTLLLTVISL